MTFHQSMCIRCMMRATRVGTPVKKIWSLQWDVAVGVRSAHSLASAWLRKSPPPPPPTVSTPAQLTWNKCRLSRGRCWPQQTRFPWPHSSLPCQPSRCQSRTWWLWLTAEYESRSHPRPGSRSGGEWGPGGGEAHSHLPSLVDGEAERSGGHGESKKGGEPA